VCEKARQVAEALGHMNSAIANLPLAPAGLGAAFRDELPVQLAAMNHIAERVLAWDAALDGRTSDAEHHLRLARTHFSALSDWDSRRTEAPYWNLSRNMLRSASWHTEQVARLLAAP
jgi:hypothetical protein